MTGPGRPSADGGRDYLMVFAIMAFAFAVAVVATFAVVIMSGGSSTDDVWIVLGAFGVLGVAAVVLGIRALRLARRM